LFFEYQICQVYVYYTYDQKAAVDYAVRLVTRLQRSQYGDCHNEHVSVYDILTHAYFYRDCLGYEKELRESLDYIEKNLPIRQETRLRMDYILTELDYENGHYQAARNKAMQYIADAEFSHPYRKSDGYLAARHVLYALGEIDLAHKYAELDATVSQSGSYQRGAADALMWQAVFAKRLGNDGAAQQIFQRGIAQYQQFDMSPSLTYFDAAADYYELSGDSEQALKLRLSQFEELPARGSLHDMALAHLQYCRLLGRMGKPVDEVLKKARDFINTLRKPAAHDTALKHIEAGNYYQFDWQRELKR
jgi:tetratricopeptide (TPR) repeat protein